MSANHSNAFFQTLPKPIRSYLDRVGAELVNPRRAIIKRHFGNYYKEVAVIKITSDNKLKISNPEYLPSEVESESIKAALTDFQFPKTVRAKALDNLLPKLKGHQHYPFYDQRDGSIIMVQERRLINGRKNYIPWVMLDNGDWVSMEPDEGLPFFKPKLPHAGQRIMIHEGAKAASAAQAVADDAASKHPWHEELKQYAHWGMIGGALAPHRTNYSELQSAQPPMVIYVCDHDAAGEGVLQAFSKFWGGPMRGIMFGDDFPDSWDMADPMPAIMFRKGRFLGKNLHELMKPATWATSVSENEDGRKVYHLNTHFVDEWLHCVKPDVYIHKDMPNKFHTPQEFNDVVRPYSDVDMTHRLLMAHDRVKSVALQYVPAQSPGVFNLPGGGGRVINTHVPSTVIAEPGDATLWEEFLEHLIPGVSDREEVVRWCATLACCPEVRMMYGLLLVSEVQGVGKSTLGGKVLADLVGKHNVSVPGEKDVVQDQFNEWVAHKRLAVIHEIYSGHSYKAYNNLKSVITDPYLMINQKYMSTYTIENWVHVFACSNAFNALKISMDDRRWFVPRIADVKLSNAFWLRLYDWLNFENGVGIIKHWFIEWLKTHDAVATGAESPVSDAKMAMVEENYSQGQLLVAQKLKQLAQKANGSGVFTLDVFLRDFVQQALHSGHFSEKLEKLSTCRRVALDQGWYVGKVKAHVPVWGEKAYNARVIASDEATAALSPGELARDGKTPIDVTGLM